MGIINPKTDEDVHHIIGKAYEGEAEVMLRIKKGTVDAHRFAVVASTSALIIVGAGAVAKENLYMGSLTIFWFLLTIFYALRWYDQYQILKEMRLHFAAATIRGFTSEDGQAIAKIMRTNSPRRKE